MLPALLHGEELEEQGIRLLTPTKKPVGGELTEVERMRNRRLSSRRAIGEHPFHVIKNIFGYTKVRYRGILKNVLHLNTLCMLASLYLKRRVLVAAQG